MEVVEQIADVHRLLADVRKTGRSIGFVPTMGALHQGHISLMQSARAEQDYVAVSIFVNPTQFAPHEDLDRYPRPRERDLELCAAAGVNLVFYPSVTEMYRPGASTFVTVNELTDAWEGAIRPGHFRGVTTVVAKLFHIVPADVAYFGQKDYQQQEVICRMVRDMDFQIEMRNCPTLRDPDGLAMSSRNAYLSADERQAGLCLSRALRAGEQQFRQGVAPAEISRQMQELIASEPGAQLEYAIVADPDSLVALETSQAHAVALVACRVGKTRLIDNALWTCDTEATHRPAAN